MRHCIAKSLRNDDDFVYINMREDMKYSWHKTLTDAINTLDFHQVDDDCNETLDEWIDDLTNNEMSLVMEYTKYTHPEFFV